MGQPGVRRKQLGIMKALKKEKILFRLNWRGDMHMKWIGKMVVIAKFQFLLTMIGKLHQFTLVNWIKIYMQIKEPFRS